MFVVGRVGLGRVVIRYDKLRKCVVGYQFDRLCEVCSRVGQVFILYDQ